MESFPTCITELLENAGARGTAVRARLRLSGHHQADKLAAREQALDDLVYRNHHLALKILLSIS
jgi:hypothetical protein